MSKYIPLLAILLGMMYWNNPMRSQVVAVEVDTIAVHTGMVGGVDLTGYTTYRFYVVMANAESKLLDIYGNVDHPLLIGSTGSIWNLEANTTIREPSATSIALYPEASFDTWFDLEDVFNPNGLNFFICDYSPSNNSFQALFLLTTPESEAIQALMSPIGGALCNISPTSSDTDLRIRFAQITTNGSPLYQFNFHTAFLDCSGEIQSQSFATADYVIGCNNPMACNYDPNLLEVDYSTCVFPGCTDPNAINYSSNPGCTAECIYSGPCTNQLACNFDPSAIYQDFSTCEYPGCSDPLAINYQAAPLCEGECIYVGPCTDPVACNYDSSAIYTDTSTCTYPGCTNPYALNYSPDAQCDGDCIFACSVPYACNYDPNFVISNTSDCEWPGCWDPDASNYNPDALCDGGNCYYLCVDPNACNYQMYAVACQYSTTTFHTFYDIDEDGQLTGNDPQIHYPAQIEFPDLNLSYYYYAGNSIPIEIPPPVDIVFMPNFEWDVVGSNEMTITTGCSTMDILLTPVDDPWSTSFFGSPIRTAGILQGRNSVAYRFQHWLDQPVEYHCTLGFDPILPLLHPITNQVVPGSSYSFVENGIFDEQVAHQFHFQIPTEDLIGTIIDNTLSCVATDQLGVELFSFEHAISRVVMGPYDPNIKIDEPAGWYEPEFIAPNADLTYTIYFQNNGNAPAERVVVVDSLDVNSYDLNSLEFIYASDTMSYMLDYTTGVVTFTFDDIYLPDSLSDPEGSIGYFQYRIAPLNNLSHMHQIRNKAYIYFDNNSPIITPTTLQTIFDCASLEREPIALARCPGDSIAVEAFAEYIDGVHWSMNDVWLGDSNTLVIDSLPSGDHLLHYTFSNPGCSVTNTIPIMIHPTLIIEPWWTPEGLTTGYDDLYHTWYFNEEEIIGNNTALLDTSTTALQYGIGVIVTDTYGCNHSYYEYLIDVNELENTKITLYPNPVSDFLILHHEGSVNNLLNIEILNALGQVVTTPQIVLSNSSLMIDVHTLPDGMYVLQVNGQPLTNSKVIKN